MAKRGSIRLKISTRDHDIPKRIEKALEDAIRTAATDIGYRGREVAQSKIRQEDAIFTRELLESFTHSNTATTKGRRVRIKNRSDHAEFVEHGTEHYTRAPPLAALIPWVEVKLQGWTVENGRLVPK